MDLTVSDRHQAFKAEVEAFIADHGHLSPPAGGGRRRPGQKEIDWQKRLIEAGYAARTVPTRYGGYGAEPDILEQAIIVDAFGRARLSTGLANQGTNMLVPTLLEVGTQAQCEAYIRPTIMGEIFWCQGYSEPGAGSDLAAAKTKAELVGDEFVVNGQKIWTSSAHFADMIFLLCRTEPDAPKHAGLSYLLLSMSSPGIEVRPLKTMNEQSSFNEVFFTDVRVPADQIVMGRGRGWEVANITLKHERQMLGDPNKLVHRVAGIKQLMTETVVDGAHVIDIPEFRERLLRLQAEVHASRFHNMRLLTERLQGRDPGLAQLVVKLSGTTLAHKLSALAIDVLGAAGLAYDPESEDGENDPATNWYIDYMYDIGLIIGGGSSQIQKNIIGERGLGLPREPKPAQPSQAAAGG